MVLVNQPAGVDTLALIFGFRQAARVTWSTTGESGRVNGWRTSCARRHDSAVSPGPLGGTGMGRVYSGTHESTHMVVVFGRSRDDGGWRVWDGDTTVAGRCVVRK